MDKTFPNAFLYDLVPDEDITGRFEVRVSKYREIEETGTLIFSKIDHNDEYPDENIKEFMKSREKIC